MEVELELELELEGDVADGGRANEPTPDPDGRGDITRRGGSSSKLPSSSSIMGVNTDTDGYNSLYGSKYIY